MACVGFFYISYYLGNAVKNENKKVERRVYIRKRKIQKTDENACVVI